MEINDGGLFGCENTYLEEVWVSTFCIEARSVSGADVVGCLVMATQNE